MIDLHCHLLPGIDDGAKDLQQTLAMARIAVADGIVMVTATPHHLNGIYRNDAAEVRRRVNALNLILKEQQIDLQVLAGSELHLVPELPSALREGSALTIADRRQAALVELPVHTIPMGAEEILEDLLAMDIQPVIAHPERNTDLRRNPDRLRRWRDMGCLGQVTAQSFEGRFGPEVKTAAETMLRAGLIQVMASDAHRDERRVPRLTEGVAAVTRLLNAEIAELMCRGVPASLIQGEWPDIDAFLGLEARRRRWWFW